MADSKRTSSVRRKRDTALWIGLILSAGAHFALFAYWPAMEADDFTVVREEIETVDLPPDVEIPPPPQQIARPARPVISDIEIDDDITIAPTTFEENPVEELPPPPAEENTGSISDAPTFTPYTVRPDLKNRAEVGRLLMREYPELLRDAGIGGTTQVWFFIDEEGRVLDTRINKSSGHEGLDQAALRVAEHMEFSPALNRDRKVKVWVQFPITFQVR